MRYLLILTGSIVLLVLIFFAVTATTIKSLSMCISEYNLAVKNGMSVARQERLGMDIACSYAKPMIENFRSCYNSVGEQSIIPVDIVFTVSRIIRPGSIGENMDNLRDVINKHNSSCSDHPEAQIL